MTTSRPSQSPRRRPAASRTLPRVRYWLKVTGTAERPFDDGDWAARRRGWVAGYGEVSMFPRVPRIEAGDRLVDYAVGSHRFFGEGRLYAVHEVLSDPEPSPHERWPVQVPTRLAVAGPRLEFCPSIDEIGVWRRSLGRHSHIRLSDEQGRRAEELITQTAAEFGALHASMEA
jgi:hypothetical protein